MAGTREAIIEAAMRGFAEKGFEATGIREIAAAAGCNVAAISYHFGGKEGLRSACAGHIVAVMGKALAAAGADDSAPEDAADAEVMLAGLVRDFVRFLLLAPEGQLVVGFMLREMTQPSDALDTIYEGLLEGVHRRACALWGAATGQAAESEAVRLAVFGTIGQILYFRVARPVVTKRMGWPAIGAAEAGAIGNAIVRTLHARLAADRGERR